MTTKQQLLIALQTRYPLEEGETTLEYVKRLEERKQPEVEMDIRTAEEYAKRASLNGRDRLKQEALEIIAQQNREQLLEENKDVEL